jgi:hypothetical protein
VSRAAQRRLTPRSRADPLRRPGLPAQPPLAIIGRTGKPVRLRGRLSSNVRPRSQRLAKRALRLCRRLQVAAPRQQRRYGSTHARAHRCAPRFVFRPVPGAAGARAFRSIAALAEGHSKSSAGGWVVALRQGSLKLCARRPAPRKPWSAAAPAASGPCVLRLRAAAARMLHASPPLPHSPRRLHQPGLVLACALRCSHHAA